MRHLLLSIYALFFILISVRVNAAEPNTLEWMRSHYEKKEYMIPMRDGVRLYSAVYVPKDNALKSPILIMRTPYGCGYYGPDVYDKTYQSYMSAYLQRGYIIVKQDVRGRYRSEGIFEDIRPLYSASDKKAIDEATDVYDTVEWLLKHIRRNNGRVGLVGNSYPGFYALMGGLSGHPAVKAISPQAPVIDWFKGDDWHQHGAFKLTDAFHFMNGFGRPVHGVTDTYGPAPVHHTTDEYSFFQQKGPIAKLSRCFGDTIAFWLDMLRHPNYDSWWQERCPLQHCGRLNAAVLVVGGFFDAEDSYGTFALYRYLQSLGKSDLFLAAGPWSHGQWRKATADHLGDLSFGSNTAAFFQQQIEIPFFAYYLEGKGNRTDIAGASIIFSGSNRKCRFDSWPPQHVVKQNLYLSSDRKSDWGKASLSRIPNATKSEYVSNPSRPVPYSARIAQRRNAEYMTADQRFASRRPDVLTYISEPLESSLTLAGKLGIHLNVSVDATDADFVVKLIDVYPDNNKVESLNGYQMLIRGEVMRGRYRNDYSKPQPFSINLPETVDWQTVDVGHTFESGHRLMVQIQSTWFPLIDLNPQQFVDIYTCKTSDFRTAKLTVYEGGENGSYISLPVLEMIHSEQINKIMQKN